MRKVRLGENQGLPAGEQNERPKSITDGQREKPGGTTARFPGLVTYRRALPAFNYFQHLIRHPAGGDIRQGFFDNVETPL